MQDFKVEQDNYGGFDLVVEDKQFAGVDGFETAVDYQLFVNRRANKSEIGEARQREGWIGDLITKKDGYESGSLMYLKRQSRSTPQDRAEAAAYAEDGLLYLVAIGAAERVTAQSIGDRIEGKIQVRADDVNRYSRLWRATDAVES